MLTRIPFYTVIYRIGMVVFPGFQALDVFGPLDALNLLSLSHRLNLSVISTDLQPVSTKPRSSSMNLYNSTFGEFILPTHSVGATPELDVLIVPGGLGTRAPDLYSLIEFVGKVYPSLKYLITVCTGAGIAARSGIMDGRKATTNKAAWNATTHLRPQVLWQKEARWVVDGNIWSSSGVSAGIDVTLAWISHVYGDTQAQKIANGMEYIRHTNASDDPFAALYGL